ncbi:NUC189-domain-containing protein [Lojkania enalia]|uniref:NUC189-domain-containing protein n=1 Tax=Lojkania enalia TaxID=147567 RepID=A0A9P4KGL2_9PLEO|nr:NUC189-domain-containing protein [Didymosphaeria enalia]
MPAPIASHVGGPGKASRLVRDSRPPAKKTKLSQPPTASPPPQQQNGLKSLINGAPGKKPAVAAKVNGVKNNAQKETVDDATAVVGGGLAGHGDVDIPMADAPAAEEVIEISSGEDESEFSSEADNDEEDGGEEEGKIDRGVQQNASAVNGDAQEENQSLYDAAEPEELSFGEKLQAQDPEQVAPHIVDVESAFIGPNGDTRALALAAGNRPLTTPSASSLGTVLTQALRTNDRELLESCLREVDVDTIYATVERLPSPLVGNLLQKLAEHIHRKPGRAGMLMIWVQWSLAAHGGYLASQPQLVKQLATLNKVLKERAGGLQPLLSLKGRLDMLHAQLELRRRNQKRAADDEEEEAIIYVEGEDDVSSEDGGDQSSVDSGDVPTSLRKRLRGGSAESGDESSADEMPATMEMDDIESDEGSEDSEDMVDDEAEETDNDTGDDLSEPTSDDDLEGLEDGSGSEEELRPARRSTIGRAGLSRRH